MLWTFASLIALFAVTTVGPRWLMDRIGYLRQLSGSKKSVDPPGMNGIQLGGVMSPTRVAINFEDIELVTNGTRRLNGITGSIRPGSFTAIMGASGCG
jgi:ABC-type multidrug transport system fused ATPase/permease subunit